MCLKRGRRANTLCVRDAVKPSIGYEANQFFFGFNYLDWRDGWPVVVAEDPTQGF
jgi:hypothetical protein